MMQTRRWKELVLMAAVMVACQGAQADDGTKTKPLPIEVEKTASAEKFKEVDSHLFTEDRITLQVVQGPQFSGTSIGPSVPAINFVQQDIRLGWILNTPKYDGTPLDGCFEAVLESAFSKVFTRLGDVMYGPTGLVRYNFVQPDWKVIPYVQGGAGFVYDDIYLHKDQRAVGNGLEFTPQASVGARFLIDSNWSLDTEVKYLHVSNADTASRNLGVNSLGGEVGFTYFFNNLWKD